MQQLYEPLLIKYSVDLVFNGHVHCARGFAFAGGEAALLHSPITIALHCIAYTHTHLIHTHIHTTTAYERVKPVNNWELDATGCAPAHIVIGDAGNIEGMATSYVTSNFAPYCADPTSRSFPPYQPQECFAYNTGNGSGCAGTEACYCWATQPAWSAYREPSFGHGRLIFESATQASWSWTRNVGGAPSVADAVNITRLPSCSGG